MASTHRISRLRLRPARTLNSCTRAYHSREHSPPPGPFNAVELSILSAAAQHVPSHGFTHKALALGAKDAGYLDVSTNLFPRGAFSLVHYHLVSKRNRLVELQEMMSSNEGNAKQLSIGANVKALTWARLMENKHIIHRWQEALALMAVPSNISISLEELASLSNDIWFLAGDTSVDTTWYTKRASLSSIYAATDLFMTTDKSPSFDDTKGFMNRRFQDGQHLGSAVGSFSQWVGFTAGAGINILRSKGVRV